MLNDKASEDEVIETNQQQQQLNGEYNVFFLFTTTWIKFHTTKLKEG